MADVIGTKGNDTITHYISYEDDTMTGGGGKDKFVHTYLWLFNRQ